MVGPVNESSLGSLGAQPLVEKDRCAQLTEAAITALKVLEEGIRSNPDPQMVVRAIELLADAADRQGSPRFAERLRPLSALSGDKSPDAVNGKTRIRPQIGGPLSPAVGIIATLFNEAWGELPKPAECPHKEYLANHPPTQAVNCLEKLGRRCAWLNSPKGKFLEPWQTDVQLIFRLFQWMVKSACLQYEEKPRRLRLPWEDTTTSWQHSQMSRFKVATEELQAIEAIVADLSQRLAVSPGPCHTAILPYARLQQATAVHRLARESDRAKLPATASRYREKRNQVLRVAQGETKKFPFLERLAVKARGSKSHFFSPLCVPCPADSFFPTTERAGKALFGEEVKAEDLFFLVQGHISHPRAPAAKRKVLGESGSPGQPAKRVCRADPPPVSGSQGWEEEVLDSGVVGEDKEMAFSGFLDLPLNNSSIDKSWWVEDLTRQFGSTSSLVGPV